MCGLVGYIETKDSANCSSDIDRAIASLEHRVLTHLGRMNFLLIKKLVLAIEDYLY